MVNLGIKTSLVIRFLSSSAAMLQLTEIFSYVSVCTFLFLWADGMGWDVRM